MSRSKPITLNTLLEQNLSGVVERVYGIPVDEELAAELVAATRIDPVTQRQTLRMKQNEIAQIIKRKMGAEGDFRTTDGIAKSVGLFVGKTRNIKSELHEGSLAARRPMSRARRERL